MRKELLAWYRRNKRNLPWRINRDPYRIWISEVMLQQTTVAAVVPYYERFLKRFPDVHALAKATDHQVTEMWAGLGYYSRARNLHKAAQLISKFGFPRSAKELIKLPGFGPYTANAVASLAFDERVGVLDGNVIRILSRVHGLKVEWWLPRERNKLQKLADDLADHKDAADINQAMMELGATVCTPKRPLCLLCPWKSLCVARKKDLVQILPLSRPKADQQSWLWEFEIHRRGTEIFLMPNEATPFLAGLPFPPGQARKLKSPPQSFSLRHSVTKYAIYVRMSKGKSKPGSRGTWYDLDHIKRENPSSLMTKILKKLAD